MIQPLKTTKLSLYLLLTFCCLLFACSNSSKDSDETDISGDAVEPVEQGVNVETSETGNTNGTDAGTSDTTASASSSPVSPVAIPLPRNGELTSKRIVKENRKWFAISAGDWTRDYVYEDEKIVQTKKVSETLFGPDVVWVKNFEYNGQNLSRVWEERTVGGESSTKEYTLNYELGRLVELNTGVGRYEYRYNEAGQIVGSLGHDYLYFRDCGIGLPPLTYIPNFSVTYDDKGRIVFAETDDQLYRAKFEYDSIGRMFKIRTGYVCEPNTPPYEYDNFIDIVYNELNQVVRVDELYWWPEDPDQVSSRTYRYVYNENGLLAQESREPVGYDHEVQVYSYDEDGYMTKYEYFVGGPGSIELANPAYEHTFEYENEPCKVSYSANQARLIMLDIYWTGYMYLPRARCDFVLDNAYLNLYE